MEWIGDDLLCAKLLTCLVQNKIWVAGECKASNKLQGKEMQLKHLNFGQNMKGKRSIEIINKVNKTKI